MINERIFREYDIRGIAGEDLTEEVAVSIGRAFGSYLKEIYPEAEWVSVGKDVRLSSEGLSLGLIEGITSTGISVYDVGICPTPLQYFSLFHMDLAGGIMVTGSHNPPEYNGFKLIVGKTAIYGNDIQRLREIIQRQEWMTASDRGSVREYNVIEPYKDYMLNEFSYLRDSEFKRLKVVIDAGNGTAGIIVPELLSSIGCDVVQLYCNPDGNFPNHHPDPTVTEYLKDLISETLRSGADLGVGYDGDADRIGVVDKNGDIVWGDRLMIILSRELLKKNTGAKIIGDVKCSQMMFDDIKKNGGIPIMWKTGHSLIKQKMKEEEALMAGEFSGHIFIADRYFGYDDAIYTTLRLIEIMKTTNKGITELLSDVPEIFHTPEIRISCPEDKKKNVVGRVIARLKSYKGNSNSPYKILDIDTTDGARVLFEKGWGLVRVSNTQPAIVIRIEAEDRRRLNDYSSFLEREIKLEMRK